MWKLFADPFNQNVTNGDVILGGVLALLAGICIGWGLAKWLWRRH